MDLLNTAYKFQTKIFSKDFPIDFLHWWMLYYNNLQVLTKIHANFQFKIYEDYCIT